MCASIAGLKRGEGGQAPAVLVAETPDGDYAFLDMATAAFDLTDRGVKGRNRAGPHRCLRLHRPRRLSPWRARAPDHAGARRAPAKASAVPVTLIFSRPDGVEHSRVA